MNNSSDIGAGIAILVIFYLVILAGTIAFGIWIYTSIAKKAGYNRWMGLLAFVPLLNFVIIIMFAVQQWPVERELNAYRAQAGVPPVAELPVDQTPLPGYYPGYGQPAAGGAYGAGPAGYWQPGQSGPGSDNPQQFGPPPGQYPSDGPN